MWKKSQNTTTDKIKASRGEGLMINVLHLKRYLQELVIYNIAIATMIISPLSANAEDTINILKYHPDKKGNVVAFNEKGKIVGKINVTQLPAPPTEVLAFDKKTNRVKLHTKQGDIWLLSMQVQTSRKASLRTSCMVNKHKSIGRSHVSRGLGGNSGC